MFPKGLTWRAYYDDEHFLEPPTSSDAVDRTKVKKFVLDIDPAKEKLIYRLRRTVTQDGREEPRVHLVGLASRVRNEIVHRVAWIEEGGALTATEGFDPNDPMFYPPEFREFEIP